MPSPDLYLPRPGAGEFVAPRPSSQRSHARSPRPSGHRQRDHAGAETPPAPWIFDAIGTRWSVETATQMEPKTAGRIAGLIEEFDRAFSRFRSDSLVARMSAGEGVFEIPASGQPLLDFYRDLYEGSDGSVTPLIGGSLDQLGYDASYTLRRKGSGRPAPAWDDVMAWDGQTLRTRCEVSLDLGAAGKGRLVDLVAHELWRAGHTEYTVDASGDLVHSGLSVEHVGLEHPHDPSRVIGVARISNRALAASAINRRAWGDGLHHVVDPTRGEPVDGTVATWVSADSAMVADGLATALFFRSARSDLLPPSYGRWEWVRMAVDGTVSWSNDFDGEMFR